MASPIFRTRHITRFLLAAACLWVVADISRNCTQRASGAEGQYLGNRVCGSCHEQELLAWTGSHHDLAMQPADSGSVLGDFGDVTFESNGVRYRFFTENERYFVNTEGRDSVYRDFEVQYTFGVYPLQQYMVELERGRIQCLLVAWDDVEKRWYDLQPAERIPTDDWMHWTGGSMTWNTMCADCHSTRLEKNYFEEADSFHTEWEIIDVSCEACHGPGRRHVEYIESKAYANGERVQGSHTDLPVDQGNEGQVDQCARCHSRRSQYTHVYDHTGSFPDHYVPEVLRPGLYHPDGQILDEVYVYGSFLQSKMYRRDVKCTDCHEPHSLKLKLTGNLLCTQCHEPKQYDTPGHHFHEAGGEGSLCVDCHMPGKIYMGIDFRRDHSFRVPRPDQSVQFGTPNACNGCHEDRSAEWAAEWIEEWYGPERKEHFSDHLAPVMAGHEAAGPKLWSMVGDTAIPSIVQATVVWLAGLGDSPGARQTIYRGLRHADPLVRHTAVNAMEPFPAEEKVRYLLPLLQDSVYTVRAQTAYVLSGPADWLLEEKDRQDFEKAEAEYRDVLAAQADFPTGQLQKAQYFYKKEEYEKAEQAFRKAIGWDPYLPTGYLQLAQLDYERDNFDDAERTFLELLEKRPDEASAHYSLGLLYAEMGKMEEAREALEQAARLSGNPRHYYNLGLVCQQLEQENKAEEAYLKALAIDPASELNLYALAVLYYQQDRMEQARNLAERLLQINPTDPNYRNLFGVLESGRR